MLKYKGYTGYVEFDDDAGLLHGEVLDTRDVITFQGKTVEEMRKAFRDSIDDYLQYLPFIFTNMYRALDWEDGTGLRIYASCIWNFYLSERFGNQIIPEIWYALEGSSGVFNMIDGVLVGSYGSTIEDEITGFYIWNFFTIMKRRIFFFKSWYFNIYFFFSVF